MVSQTEIIKKIKEKKELAGLEEGVVISYLKKVLKKLSVSTENLKKADIKLIVKQTRAELRNLTGRFSSSITKRPKLLNDNNSRELLNTSNSTKERAQDYPLIISEIKRLNVKSILDLGCGLNPIALSHLVEEYHAYDINENDLETVQTYFTRNKINGRTYLSDILSVDIYPRTDLCIIFKVLDLLDKKGHKNAERLITNIKSNHILISFSTKTLSGKPMNHPQRGWIERLLSRVGFKFKSIKTHNEIFYLANLQDQSCSC